MTPLGFVLSGVLLYKNVYLSAFVLFENILICITNLHTKINFGCAILNMQNVFSRILSIPVLLKTAVLRSGAI